MELRQSVSSRQPALLAIGGGAGIAAFAGLLILLPSIGAIAFMLGISTAFALLGVQIGRASGTKAMPFALLSAVAGSMAAFAIRAGIIAVDLSRNPTSHNIWPIELAVVAAETFFLGLTVFLGAAIGARSGRAKPVAASDPLD